MSDERLSAAMKNFRFQIVIAVVGTVLMAGKFGAYAITGSVAILTDALESIVNVLAGFMGLYALHLTMKPADESHPYGHGKVELISSTTEGAMIAIAGAMIIYESAMRFINPSEIRTLDVGIVIVAIAAVANFAMGYTAIRMGRASRSVALEASGKHLCSDTYSSVGIILGLCIVYGADALGYDVEWIDPAMAMLFGFIIIYTGVKVLYRSMNGIMDRTDIKILRQVVRCINRDRTPEVIEAHHLRVVSYGASVHVDGHITVPADMTVGESAEIVRKVSDDIQKELGDADVTIMAEPCDHLFCSNCQREDCPGRTCPFEKKVYIEPVCVLERDSHVRKQKYPGHSSVRADGGKKRH